VLSAALATLVIRPFDPWAAYQHLSGADLFTEFTVGFIVLVASLALSLLFDRFFCKYLCPMGAFLGLVSKIGLFKVKRNTATCIDCMACDKACPVNIPVQSLEKVKTAECLNCGECINACPVRNTLYFEGPGKARVTPLLMLVLTFVIFGLVVGSTTITGSFKWTVQSAAERTEEIGRFDPDSISGRSTFKEISDLSGIPKAAFVERFGITDAAFAAPIRDAAHQEGSTFDTEDVRAFVKEKLAEKK
jgi:NAD-dependent dihydropyrimidine dehydrogenase PreA subunit